MRELKKGSLGMLLLHLLRERPSYGYELCERIRGRSEGALSFDEGAVYPLLHEYERGGLVTGCWEGSDGEPLPGRQGTAQEPQGSQRKGPRRRYYRLTDRGLQALEMSVAEWFAFADGVGRVLGRRGGKLEPILNG